MKRPIFAAYFLLYNFIGFTVAIGGWLWEVLLFFIKERQFVNRGFLYGPYLPVYGIGAIILSILFLQHFPGIQNMPGCAANIRLFLVCMVGGSMVEFVTGWLLWKIFHQRYWDYTNSFLNIHGYVCLYSALGFGFFGWMWVRWIAPCLIHAWEKISFSGQMLLMGLLDALLAADIVFSLMNPNDGKNITFSLLP